MKFAEKIKTVRIKLQLTQDALATEMGVSFATINRWENQGKKPQLSQVGKFNEFCKKHDISFD